MRWVVLFLLLPLSMSGQIADESLVQPEDSPSGYPDDDYYFRRTDKADLNTATVDELVHTGKITRQEAEAIVRYRNRYGRFYNFPELQTVPGISGMRALEIAEWLTLRLSTNRTIKSGQISFTTKYIHPVNRKFALSEAAGGYLGPPISMVIRVRQYTGPFRISLTMANQVGEPFLWAPKKGFYGFDHLAFHLQYQHPDQKLKVVVGDYRLQLGQGLRFGSTFRSGLTDPVNTARQILSGVTPYQGTTESGYLRGGAIALTVGQLKLELFAGGQTLFGKADSLTTETFLNRGLHRTRSEINTQVKAVQIQTGVHANYTKNNNTIGISGGTTFTTLNNKFSDPFLLTYFETERGKLLWFGELLIQNNSRGALIGYLVPVTTRLDFAFRAKTIHGEINAQNDSEKGVDFHLKYQIAKKISITGKTGFIQTSELQYRINSPSVAHRTEVMIHVNFTGNTELFVRLTSQGNDRNVEQKKTYTSYPYKREQYMIRIRNKGLIIQEWNLIYTSHSFKKETGFLASWSTVVKMRGGTFRSRLIGFLTGGYDSRIYLYENDSYDMYIMKPWFGSGTQALLMYERRISGQFSCLGKWTSSTYQEKTGNSVKEITFGIRIKT